MFIYKPTESYDIQWAHQGTVNHIFKTYLCHVCLLINGHKDFVEKRFKIITLDTVHDKAFQRGHWKTRIMFCMYQKLYYKASFQISAQPLSIILANVLTVVV